MSEKASSGDQVAVRYTGKLTDGTVFDSNQDGDPLQFELGKGQVISGFEEAVSGRGREAHGRDQPRERVRQP